MNKPTSGEFTGRMMGMRSYHFEKKGRNFIVEGGKKKEMKYRVSDSLEESR